MDDIIGKKFMARNYTSHRNQMVEIIDNWDEPLSLVGKKYLGVAENGDLVVIYVHLMKAHVSSWNRYYRAEDGVL